MTRPNAIVVGGGPAGALAAKVLCERGFDVQLFEAYPHPNESGDVEKAKAYVISINARGQRALKRCGVDPLSLEGAVLSEAIVGHPAAPGKRFFVMKRGGKDGMQGSVVVRRRALAAGLLDLAAKKGVSVRCGWRLADVDFDDRVAVFAQRGGSGELREKYDLLIGADGVQSRTRHLLSQRADEFHVETQEDTMEYQVAILHRPLHDLLLEEVARGPPMDTCPQGSTHSWNDKSRKSTALAFPIKHQAQQINAVLVCVIFPGGQLGQMKAQGSAGYSSALSALFSDWTADARSDLARSLSEPDNHPNSGGTCVWSSALSIPRLGIALVGDAGHGMWPSLGQGCNSALESVSVLADAIEAASGTVSSGAGCRATDFENANSQQIADAVCHEYNGLRYDDAIAAVDLTHAGMGGTKVRGDAHSPTLFKIQIVLFLLLNKMTAGVIPGPALFRTMRGADTSYSSLKRAMKMEKMVTMCLLVGIVGGIAKLLI